MGRIREFGTHNFAIGLVIFSYKIPILWCTSSQGKCLCFLINLPYHGKRQPNSSNKESMGNWLPVVSYKNHRMWITWEISTHSFPIVGVLFSHQIRIPWYTSLHGKCMGFLIKSPIASEKAAKPIEWGMHRKLVSILFP